MRIANTFIVGAPKCGTTALCHYLSQHPHAFVCNPKEPHYFARFDMPSRKHYIQDEVAYQKLYTNCSKQHKALVDGSIWHLYCKNAVRLVAEYNPNAKIIVMLRRPDEMVYSFHSQALESYDEDIVDFNTAWSMATGKLQRKAMPEYCFAPSVLAYDKIACYGTQLKNVYRHFPANQIHLIFYDDFSKNSSATYHLLLTFLGLEHFTDIEFENINANSIVRNRVVGKLLTHPPQSLIAFASAVKNLFGIEKLGVLKKLNNYNIKSAPRTKIDEDTRLDIICNYKDEIRLLQDITGRDLSSWLK